MAVRGRRWKAANPEKRRDIERSADLSAVKATATYSKRHKDEVREFVTGNEQRPLPFEDEGED